MEKAAMVPLHTFGHLLADGSGVIRSMQCSGVSEDYLKGLYSSQH